MRLEGKTAMITGASRNIGREVALTRSWVGARIGAHFTWDKLSSYKSSSKEHLP